MNTTALYASIFGLLFVLLSVRTIRLRRHLRIPIGDGGDPLLQRAIAVHANFAEYVPIALLLIYLLEIVTRSVIWPHLLCIALLIGRISHAYGVSQVRENFRFRVTGMMLTFGVIIGSSAGILGFYGLSLGK